MHLELITEGNDILGKISKPVEDISSLQFQEFITDLIEACFEYDGVGIAAPQVGVSKQVFIMAAHPNSRYPDSPQMEVEAVINPKIIWQSEDLEKDWEGCLSVPGKRGLVNRPIKIKTAYTNRQGELIETEFEDFFARLFLHEYDHLIGVLYPQRMDKADSLISYEDYLERMKEEDT